MFVVGNLDPQRGQVISPNRLQQGLVNDSKDWNQINVFWLGYELSQDTDVAQRAFRIC